MNEILTDLSIEMTKTVFSDWIDRLQRGIDGNGEYIAQNTSSIFLN
jgi:hypothetical protein